MNADRHKRLVAVNVTNNQFDFQQRQGFIPNGAKPIPTLQEALTALDAIPVKAGRFGSKKPVFAPNEKPDTHPDMQSPSKPRKIVPSKIQAQIPEGLHVYNKMNKDCFWDEKRAGFWRMSMVIPTSGKKLPYPVVTTCFGYKKAEFIFLLEELQAKVKPHVFRGFAPNRWTGEFNGCAEFRVDGWHWPEGYITYLKEGVLPSRSFYQFVTGKDLKGLPTYQPK
ncbi:hypothetical protein D3C85_956910 [compost metagenome]